MGDPFRPPALPFSFYLTLGRLTTQANILLCFPGEDPETQVFQASFLLPPDSCTCLAEMPNSCGVDMTTVGVGFPLLDFWLAVSLGFPKTPTCRSQKGPLLLIRGTAC